MKEQELKEYNAIKAQYPNAVLLFRVGDFYEAYFEDAKMLSEILQKEMAERSDNTPTVCMHYDAIGAYIPIIVRAGYRVAVCDALNKKMNPKVEPIK